MGDFILYFNFFCELDTLSLHSLLLLLAPEQIPLEVIGQVFQPQLSTHPLNPYAAHQFAPHTHHPGPKDMLDFGTHLRFIPIRCFLLLRERMVAIPPLMNLAAIAHYQEPLLILGCGRHCPPKSHLLHFLHLKPRKTAASHERMHR